MRRMTLLWLMLAAICGGVLFHTSQQVTDGRARLNVLTDDVRKEDETIRVLQAEWSYLNQPDRLEKLSKQYLNLAPLTGRQFTKLQNIPDRPAEAAATAAPVQEPEEPAAPVAAAAAPEKPATVKSPAVKTAAQKAPLIKIRKQAAAPIAAKAAPPATASDSASRRSFGDMIKSLGVR